MKWAICCNCGGDGSHARNLGVINPDEWTDEELEAYRCGAYDTACEDCDGSGKVRTGQVFSKTSDGWTDRWLYCECGRKHWLEDDDSCCECGQLYNAFGQRLKPVDQWSEL
jgi:hypothetical protein